MMGIEMGLDESEMWHIAGNPEEGESEDSRALEGVNPLRARKFRPETKESFATAALPVGDGTCHFDHWIVSDDLAAELNQAEADYDERPRQKLPLFPVDFGPFEPMVKREPIDDEGQSTPRFNEADEAMIAGWEAAMVPPVHEIDQLALKNVSAPLFLLKF